MRGKEEEIEGLEEQIRQLEGEVEKMRVEKAEIFEVMNKKNDFFEMYKKESTKTWRKANDPFELTEFNRPLYWWNGLNHCHKASILFAIGSQSLECG